MKKRYDEIMDKLEVTDEMKSRILTNIQNTSITPAAPARVRKLTPVGRWLAMAACLALVVTGVLTRTDVRQELPSPGPGDVVIGTPLPVTELSSAEELSDSIGFYVEEITNLPFEVKEAAYRAYREKLAEITYTGDDGTATFRKSLGPGDNSGSCAAYEKIKELAAGPVVVTLKGETGDYTLAIWFDGTYSYSLNLPEGLTEAEWKTLLTKVTD